MSKIKLNHLAKTVSAECLGSPARQAARMITREYDLKLSTVAVTLNQFSILTAIECMGENAYALGIGNVLGIERSTLSRDLEKLKSNGWVTSGRIEGRTEYLKLSQAGQELYLESYKKWREAQEALKQMLPTSFRATLSKGISAFQASS